MAYSLKFLLTIFLAYSMASELMARPLDSGPTLRARLQLDSEFSCWDALFELQSCTGEVIMFFLNRETTHLGKSCCQAIHIIEHQCWPSMLTSLGFTPQEGNILLGYCDASDHDPNHSAPPCPE
ncbi:hypothetical protein HS088_TW02G00837 [Tripterygium wilfordii]|uniref:Prolamin-like domain-containing protein n=1 Tax=Tripterygium wilfordii TaxID=458696 RepID=A0A7J7DZV8_TRIWF|nr:hypothetical protein HS088_TW02G00837 [Tripterygium wilfordii]